MMRVGKIQLSQAITIALMASIMFMTLSYIWSLLRKDSSIVDIEWGIGFVVVAISLAISSNQLSRTYWFVFLMVISWGIRLFWHILKRNIKNGEDWRYQNWRQDWGKDHWWKSFLIIFMLQSILLVLVSAPLIIASQYSDTANSVYLYIGIFVWSVGYYFEVVGDYQLTRFIENRSKLNSKKKKKTKFMQTGLWSLTRHPNYFGEVTMWWGLWFIVLPLEYGWFAVISPLVISFLLLKISGIPMLEKKWQGDKQFEAYRKQTNAFFPFRKRIKS